VSFLEIELLDTSTPPREWSEESSSASEEQCIAAYEAIADEYDSPEHRTTGELTRLSCLAIDEPAVAVVFDRPGPSVVELGCGTGAFTVGLRQRMRGGRLLISDPSMRMLRHAERRLENLAGEAGDSPSHHALRSSARQILPRIATPPDLIAAGLADPYLSNSLLRQIRRASTVHTHFLVTVPTRRWAVVERGGRLGVPLELTRFRTQEGHIVRSPSLTLESDELAKRLSASGFRVVGHGTIESQTRSWKTPPEIAWALGRPAVSPV
jgi:SAM-dependent methyltransferase